MSKIHKTEFGFMVQCPVCKAVAQSRSYERPGDTFKWYCRNCSNGPHETQPAMVMEMDIPPYWIELQKAQNMEQVVTFHWTYGFKDPDPKVLEFGEAIAASCTDCAEAHDKMYAAHCGECPEIWGDEPEKKFCEPCRIVRSASRNCSFFGPHVSKETGDYHDKLHAKYSYAYDAYADLKRLISDKSDLPPHILSLMADTCTEIEKVAEEYRQELVRSLDDNHVSCVHWKWRDI